MINSLGSGKFQRDGFIVGRVNLTLDWGRDREFLYLTLSDKEVTLQILNTLNGWKRDDCTNSDGSCLIVE